MTALAQAWPEAGIALGERTLVVSFAARVRACSWAIVGGGFTWARHVAWLEVRDDELRPPVDARDYARARLRAAGLDDAVALLTSRRVATFESHAIDDVRAVATVGLGNALRAGDPAGVAGRIGTINVHVHIGAPLSDAALVEASSVATEAKTAAVLEAGVASRVSGRAATGTGTDCAVITCVAGARTEAYAGKHTRIGALVGATAFHVVDRGVRRWLAENAR
jgi:adenosylcobinamide amidohydrolase